MIEKILKKIVLVSSSCKAYKLVNPSKEDVAEMNAYKKCYEIVQEVAKEYGKEWIPFTQREMTEDEKEYCETQEGYMLDCPLPEEDEEILVTYANGTVDVDTFMRDGNECYLDSGNDLVTEAIAWRKKPAPYQKGE